MPQRWFLSYNSRDFTVVDSLQSALRRTSADSEVFFAPKSLRAGGYWLPTLAEGIANANAFALIVGENGLGPWQVMEYYEALDRRVKSPDFPVVLVLLDGQPAPGLAFLRQLHWIVTPDPGSEKTAGRLVDAAAGGGSPPGELWRYTSPYRGLAAMTEADSDFFFGRQLETKHVLTTLCETSDRLPILLGNSGVGKSSLAQAGVLAALKRQALPGEQGGSAEWPVIFHDSRRWCSLTLKPGTDPIKALVEPFLDTWQFSATDPDRARQQNGWIELLRDKKATLHDLLDATERRYQELNEPKPPAFFIYIDQGEELYVRSEEIQRQRFSALLSDGLADPRLHAMMSMRADFLGALQNDPPLYSVHEKIDVPPLRELELYEAVSRPPAMLAARFETDGLAADIARRTAEESIKDAGALPLLSYLLDDMWTQMVKRGDGVLRLPAQAMELGGVLANRANAFLARNPKSEETLRHVLTLKLATVRENGDPTRRLARRSEFTDEEWRLVSELADHPHRLLVIIKPDEGETYAEVAHEAIFRRWDKLREWITAEREFLIWKSKLEAARRSWEESPEHSRNDALLMGLSLAQAQGWLARRAEDIGKTDREFIDRSIRRDVLEREQREALRRRMFGTAIAALIIVSALAVFSFFQWRDAVKQQQLAQQESDRAEHAVMTFLYRLMTGAISGDQATAALDSAIKTDPTDTTSYFLRAMFALQKQDWAGTISDLSQVITLDPSSVAAYLARASAYQNTGDLDRSIADLDQVLKLNPNDANVYDARGYAYSLQQKYDLAIADYNKAIELSPKLAVAFDNRGNAYLAEQNYDQALADYSQAIAVDPKNANAYYWYDNRGLVYSNKQMYDQAIADYTQAVAVNPKFAVAFNHRGNAYFAKNDLNRAIADYSQAITLSPDDANNSYYYFNNRGNSYYKEKKYDQAISDLSQSIALNPKYAIAFNNRGNAYYAKNDNDHALADYTQAITLSPNDPGNSYFYFNNRGNIYLNEKKYDEAIADFTGAIGVNPKFADAYRNRGNANLAELNYTKAIADFDQVLTLQSNDALTLSNRCWSRTAISQDVAAAVEDCTAALKITPNNALVLERRGFAELRLGQVDAALADFNAALQINAKLAGSLYGRSLAKQAGGDAAGAAADLAAAKAVRASIVTDLAQLGFK
jgi:tetratricopeptide (TPR) repeat protein